MAPDNRKLVEIRNRAKWKQGRWRRRRERRQSTRVNDREYNVTRKVYQVFFYAAVMRRVGSLYAITPSPNYTTRTRGLGVANQGTHLRRKFVNLSLRLLVHNRRGAAVAANAVPTGFVTVFGRPVILELPGEHINTKITLKYIFLVTSIERAIGRGSSESDRVGKDKVITWPKRVGQKLADN